jgi:fumarylacetoacetate (FAA) hydrolase
VKRSGARPWASIAPRLVCASRFWPKTHALVVHEARHLKDGSRDGQLVVVSRDLADGALRHRHRHPAAAGAGRLELPVAAARGPVRHAQRGKARHAFAFEPRQCMAPLPRAYQWADGSGYLTTSSWCAARAVPTCPTRTLRADPLMYQGGSDDLLGPDRRRLLLRPGRRHRLRGRAGGDHRRRADGRHARQALDGVRLLMLVNDWTLRHLVPAEMAKGFGFVQSKPATAFGPVAVTPDELGEAWQRRSRAPAAAQQLERRRVGLPDAGRAWTSTSAS